MKMTLFYAVYWSDDAILKVGIANHMGRVRKHLHRGAKAAVLVRGRGRYDERNVLKELNGSFNRRFANWQSATKHLGDAGSGYTECFVVPPDLLDAALKRVFLGLARG